MFYMLLKCLLPFTDTISFLQYLHNLSEGSDFADSLLIGDDAIFSLFFTANGVSFIRLFFKIVTGVMLGMQE